jgi:glycosyltransferase involved in cell wall biosynthesis
VAPSKYLGDRLETSLLAKNFEIHNIHHGVSTSIFKKHDKYLSRNSLCLPQDKTLILFGAAYMNRNKGLDYLLEALKLAKDRTGFSNTALVIFGPKQDLDMQSKKAGCPIYQLGYIYDEALLSAVYSSCDLTIIPSLQENFTQVCLESMACETPVVGTRTGAMLEMIIPHKTGFLTEQKDVADLADKMEYMVTHPEEREIMGKNARKVAEEAYPLEVQVNGYHALYKAILKK